jgi:hypothetical protein
LGVLSKIGLWRFVEALKKCRKWLKIPMHTCTLSKFREGHFQGFRDFQLRIEVKFRKKGVFDVFWKNFSLLRFTGWRSTYLHGAKIWTSFFSKSAEHVFGFGSDLCCFTRENPSGRKWRRLQITL